MSLDKRVFNVGKDLANQGGTAADILDNVPSVQVDVDGAVSLRGNENVRILVDGKPSGLIGVGDSDGLRQIPSNLIDKVEVITNPSARYEAQGMTGIINIVLKKDRQKGLNGTFDFTVGYPENFGAAINLNYRRKKMNMFVNYGAYYRKNPGSGNLYQETFRKDSTFILEEIRTHNRGGLSNSFRFGSDFFFNPKNTLTAAFSYRISDENNAYDLEYRDYITDLNNFLGSTIRQDNEVEEEADLEYSLNYKKTFSSDKHFLTADVQYEENTEVESSDISEDYFGTDGFPTGTPTTQQRSQNSEGFSRWLFRADYVYPFGEKQDGKFELGWQSGLRNVRNSYVVEQFNDFEWESIADFTNDFNYDEEIHAAYALAGNKTGNFSYQLGLRLEYTDIRTELLQTGEVNPRTYTNLFPSGHLTYEFKNENSVQLSYSRRIWRPRFRMLNPFFSYTNSRNIFTGNPNLDPEFSDVVELQHIKYWDNASLSSAVYYRQTRGVVERVRFILDETLGTTQMLPINLSTEDAYGLEFTFSYNPLKWMRLNGDFNFFRAMRFGEFNEQIFQADTYTWFTRLTSRLTIAKKNDIQLRLNYRAPRETTQGRREAMYNLDLAASRDLFKGKGTLTFSISDVFNTRRRIYSINTPSLFAEGDFQWRARSMKLTLNYRLNQKKNNRGKGRRGGGDFGGGDEF